MLWWVFWSRLGPSHGQTKYRLVQGVTWALFCHWTDFKNRPKHHLYLLLAIEWMTKSKVQPSICNNVWNVERNTGTKVNVYSFQPPPLVIKWYKMWKWCWNRMGLYFTMIWLSAAKDAFEDGFCLSLLWRQQSFGFIRRFGNIRQILMDDDNLNLPPSPMTD